MGNQTWDPKRKKEPNHQGPRRSCDAGMPRGAPVRTNEVDARLSNR